MKFLLQNDKGEDVMGGVLTEDNCYIAVYGMAVGGYPAPKDLKVGEVTKRRYSLSGQKPTTYYIVRVE